MQVQLDNVSFAVKPSGPEIGGIKARLSSMSSVVDLTAQQIAEALITGNTIQPGVCPLSVDSRAAGRIGTCS